MLVNKVVQTLNKSKVTKIELGDYFVNPDNGDCDILIVKDAEGNLKMMNAHCFMIIYNSLSEEEIVNWLNKANYKSIEAEIVIK